MKTIKLILIIAIILIIVLTIAAFVATYLSRGRQQTNNNQNANVVVTNQNTTTNTNTTFVNVNVENENISTNSTNVSNLTQPTDLEASLKTTATNFAERFGSYSNQSNYENITSLMVYMTESMQRWANQYIEQQRKANPPDAEYYGVTTKALSTKTVALDENRGTAEFSVTCQRRELRGNSEKANVIYQDIVIKFIKEKGVWKVNEARWQETND